MLLAASVQLARAFRSGFPVRAFRPPTALKSRSITMDHHAAKALPEALPAPRPQQQWASGPWGPRLGLASSDVSPPGWGKGRGGGGDAAGVWRGTAGLWACGGVGTGRGGGAIRAFLPNEFIYSDARKVNKVEQFVVGRHPRPRPLFLFSSHFG